MNLCLLALSLLPLSCILYVIWTFLALLVRQARSPLRFLLGPPSPSFFLGNLREMHDAENTNLIGQWERVYGSTFVYRGFIGGCRLMTTDPVAVTHILSRGYEYPKPDFIRDALASMAAGHEGLLVVEGDVHRRQRKILNPAFSSSHIRSISPIFWEKAGKLRDIWLGIVDSTTNAKLFAVPRDPFALKQVAPNTCAAATGFAKWVPNPFASFVSSKAPQQSTQYATTDRIDGDSHLRSRSAVQSEVSDEDGVKMDVLSWLARATLDVIGEAGFGYVFNSLGSLSKDEMEESELARAFGVIFSTARQFRVITILQVWFPILRRFRRNSAAEDAAMRTMRRIGSALIDDRVKQTSTSQFVKTADGINAEENSRLERRDLLSVLIQSSMAADPLQQLSKDEMLCQISTFLAAGHETSSAALTWTLYALSRAPHVQTKLRRSLQDLNIPTDSSSIPSDGDFQRILSNPYLDAVVRESLRLHSPVTSTMRVAGHDDIVPVSHPYRDKSGQLRDHIPLKQGDIITIPMQAMNKSRLVWGEDAEDFVPERWTDAADIVEKERALKGLWGGILTFGSGHVVNGNRSCIGYRFAINEIKIFLYVLLKDIGFSIDADVDIEKKVNVVTRPCVKSEPHMGNQMPLRLRRIRLDTP